MESTTQTAGVYEIPQDFVDFRDTIRQMVVERVAPRAAEIDATDEYPWDIRELFASHDLLGLPFGEEHGGTGTGTLMLQIAVEEVAQRLGRLLRADPDDPGARLAADRPVRHRRAEGALAAGAVPAGSSRPPSAAPSPRPARIRERCAPQRCATATSG